jgi:CheY-like chemotaxis protein
VRILLVEDHEPARTALTRLLVRRHYRVTATDCLAAARRLADQEKFDLLISDIGLPDGTGYELMAEFRDRFGLRGVALTGYGMEDDVARSCEAGIVTHLTKPVRVQSLEKALDIAIGPRSGS